MVKFILEARNEDTRCRYKEDLSIDSVWNVTDYFTNALCALGVSMDFTIREYSELLFVYENEDGREIEIDFNTHETCLDMCDVIYEICCALTFSHVQAKEIIENLYNEEV